MRSIDRRAFLGLGVGAVAWACSRGGNGEGDGDGNVGPGALSIAVTSLQLAVGDSRNAFAVLRGQKPAVPDLLDVRLVEPGRRPRKIEVERQSISFGMGGKAETTEVTDIFTFRNEFDRPGVWGLEVEVEGRSAQGAFQVLSRKQSSSPLVGEKALAVDSPTASNARGVDPICTRDPQCSMHDVTIAEALAASKPTVIIFGTPRFCTSRTCGPVVDVVEQQAERAGDSSSFVHVEVWRNDDDAVGKPGGESPAFGEWKLGTEPWIYFVDAAGVVRDRWLGAVGPKELRLGVDSLVSE